MKWVTRERPKTDRIACPWLIKNFIDPQAEFLYVPTDQVLDVAEREGAHSYDAPNAEYTHRDGLCSFEVLLEEYKLDDPALQLLARIVHGADVADDRDATPQSRGLLAVAEGFHLLNLGDHRQLELSLPVYDAPGAKYTHRDGLCSFEVLLEEYELCEPALKLLARIVHGADVADDRDATPQSRGLLAVAEGFHLLNLGDHRQLELSLPVYDALYAWCKNEVGSAGESN